LVSASPEHYMMTPLYLKNYKSYDAETFPKFYLGTNLNNFC